jgi:flagellar biosynthesis protein
MTDIAHQLNKAVALVYDGETAPTVSAMGEGDVADEILRIAQEYGIPLYENTELVSLLSQVSLDEEIPRELYQCIAEVIAFAYYLTGKKGPNQ